VASGLIAREMVSFGSATIQDQVFGVLMRETVEKVLIIRTGMINATNLTLADQQISGMVGLGFPRLSVLAHSLLEQSDSNFSSSASASPSPTTSSSIASTSISTPASASVSQAANSASASAYLPPLLESLFSTEGIPYPVFALALAPPPTNTSATSTATSASSSSTATSRYQSKIGSLTIGGVSDLYVSTDASSSRTVSDIEWWEVAPFGRDIGRMNATANFIAPPGTGPIHGSMTDSAVTADASPTGPTRRQSSSDTSNFTYPLIDADLHGEEYLFWALDLKNISVNGTDLGLSPTYVSLGVGSIALLDVGSSGIAGPQQDVARLFSMIPDARQVITGQWAVPCSTTMTIGFSFG